MSRIPALEGEPTDIIVAEVLAFAEKYGAPGPEMARVTAQTRTTAYLMKAWTRVHFGGVLPHRLKELVRIRLSVVATCGYCSSIQTDRSKTEGLSDSIVDEMTDFEVSANISEREKVALRYADKFEADTIASDEVYEELGRHFDTEEILELGMLCALTMGMGRFARSLDVRTWEQACAIKPSLTGLKTGIDSAVEAAGAAS